MKIFHILLFSLLFTNVFSQEIPEEEVKTEVKKVTVFLEGAQITRSKQVNLTQGKSTVKFINLSPFIDAKSVQVKATGNLTVLSVNHQQNYLKKADKSSEIRDLEDQLETIEDKIKIENTYLAIIKEELLFLQENRDIGGKNEQLNITNLQQASNFYSKKLTSLKLKEIEREKTLKSLNERKRDLQNQIKTITSKKEFPSGEIIIKVDAPTANRFLLEVTYLVKNASWFPSYDIRAKSINEPVRLTYKANIKQDTKVDWNNVQLKFSTADPNVSGVAPQLETYYLDYNTAPPRYNLKSNNVTGKVLDSSGEPLPGATVVVEGTTIGTTTDMNGNYSITVPGSQSQLKYSFIGFESETLPVNRNVINVSLKESNMALDELVVVGYGTQRKASTALEGRIAGVNVINSKAKLKENNLSVPSRQVENQTTVNFEIDTPYTIKSDNKSYAVDMEIYSLPAFFQYYCVPKIDQDAFLIANIVDWRRYNLLEGEANVFFEDTYVGKTLMNVKYASDTLQVSLGQDKKVAVNREKIEDFTNKQFIGNKKEVTRAWKTTVRNNKNEPINMIVLEQVPVSTRDEIEVEIEKISGAKKNPDTGEIKWEFDLEPDKEKELNLRYSVKYPKNRNLIVE